MRDWWLFLVLCGVCVALLSFWVGAVTATGVTPDIAPHGVAEYWLERYQTFIAALVALVSASFVALQIRETRVQHRANVRLAMRSEIEAVNSAARFAEEMTQRCDNGDLDFIAESLEVPLTRTFPAPDQQRLARIEQHAGEHVAGAVRILRSSIETYEQWRDQGSVIETNIFGDEGPDFERHMATIRRCANLVTLATELRHSELRRYGA